MKHEKLCMNINQCNVTNYVVWKQLKNNIRNNEEVMNWQQWSDEGSPCSEGKCAYFYVLAKRHSDGTTTTNGCQRNLPLKVSMLQLMKDYLATLMH